MREPYATLLEGLADHVLIGKHLPGPDDATSIPDFPRIYGEIDMLSSGEKTLIDIALAIYNGNPEATVADLLRLDGPNLERAVAALALTTEARVR